MIAFVFEDVHVAFGGKLLTNLNESMPEWIGGALARVVICAKTYFRTIACGELIE